MYTFTIIITSIKKKKDFLISLKPMTITTTFKPLARYK